MWLCPLIGRVTQCDSMPSYTLNSASIFLVLVSSISWVYTWPSGRTPMARAWERDPDPVPLSATTLPPCTYKEREIYHTSSIRKEEGRERSCDHVGQKGSRETRDLSRGGRWSHPCPSLPGHSHREEIEWMIHQECIVSEFSLVDNESIDRKWDEVHGCIQQ